MSGLSAAGGNPPLTPLRRFAALVCPSCSHECLAFQFWAAYLAHRLRVRRHYSWWLARYAATLIGYAGQPATHASCSPPQPLLHRRVRALSPPVSPCLVQLVRISHLARVFLTGSSATDGS